jgi:hypothetical protein
MSDNDPKAIEARLDRSLRGQVKAPRLDRGFDAAVWARIAKEEAKAAVPALKAEPTRAVRASRWLTLINALGITMTLVVAFYFALGSFGGIEPQPLNIDLNVPMPSLSEETVTRGVIVVGQVLGLVAVLFGLSFTSLGRRLRNSFS